jgi:MFS transporter, AAHS family, benzoate transport protein
MPRTDVTEFMKDSRLGRVHISVALLCGIALLADGYDVGVLGAVIPALTKSWHISHTAAGLLGSAGLAGMLFGGIGLGTVADRIGRKPSLIVSLAVFGTCAGLSAAASGPVVFGVLRFCAGLGLGGALPLTATLSAEYAPRRWRSSFVMWTSIGYATGALLAAAVSRAAIGSWGWRGVILTGAFPLLLVPVLALFLPESLEWLVRGGRTDRARRIMAAVAGPGRVAADTELYAAPSAGRVPMVRLFERRYVLRTVLLAFAFSGCLLMLYAILTWLPTLVAKSGLSVAGGLTMLILLNGGGVVGIVINGALAGRVAVSRIVLASYACVAVSLIVLGFAHSDLTIGLLAFLAGMFAYGSSVAENAYSTLVYPAELRGTGTGWGLGIGRVGAIAGPYLGGALLDHEVPLKLAYLVFASAGVMSLVAVTIVQRHRTGGGAHGTISAGAALGPVEP